MLTEAIKYLSKDNIDLIPEDSLIQNAIGNIETKDIEFSLRGALETALGGSNYVATNINANLGYIIGIVNRFSLLIFFYYVIILIVQFIFRSCDYTPRRWIPGSS